MPKEADTVADSANLEVRLLYRRVAFVATSRARKSGVQKTKSARPVQRRRYACEPGQPDPKDLYPGYSGTFGDYARLLFDPHWMSSILGQRERRWGDRKQTVLTHGRHL